MNGDGRNSDTVVVVVVVWWIKHCHLKSTLYRVLSEVYKVERNVTYSDGILSIISVIVIIIIVIITIVITFT